MVRTRHLRPADFAGHRVTLEALMEKVSPPESRPATPRRRRA
jgi:hypothetical protein